MISKNKVSQKICGIILFLYLRYFELHIDQLSQLLTSLFPIHKNILLLFPTHSPPPLPTVTILNFIRSCHLLHNPHIAKRCFLLWNEAVDLEVKIVAGVWRIGLCLKLYLWEFAVCRWSYLSKLLDRWVDSWWAIFLLLIRPTISIHFRSSRSLLGHRTADFHGQARYILPQKLWKSQRLYLFFMFRLHHLKHKMMFLLILPHLFLQSLKGLYLFIQLAPQIEVLIEDQDQIISD